MRECIVSTLVLLCCLSGRSQTLPAGWRVIKDAKALCQITVEVVAHIQQEIRLVDFWAGTVRSHADPEAIRWWPDSPIRLVTSLFLTAETLWAGCVIAGRRGVRGRIWLGACALAFSLLYVLMHVMLRYRAPIEPLLAIAAGLAFAARNPEGGAGAAASQTQAGP